MYLMDLHVHTAETSRCGHVPAAVTVSDYKRCGFNAVVITDHFKRQFFESLGTMNPHDAVDRFLLGYHLAKAAGDACGMTVLLGAEVQLPGSPNEYLLYGLTESFLYEHPDVWNLSLHDLHTLTQENGILLVQAHPYRDGVCHPADPADLDGIEVFNGHFGHRNHNEDALAFAACYPALLPTASSDCHYTQAVGNGGIRTDTLPKTPAALVTLLRDRAYTLYETSPQICRMLTLAALPADDAHLDTLQKAIGALHQKKDVAPDCLLILGIDAETPASFARARAILASLPLPVMIADSREPATAPPAPVNRCQFVCIPDAIHFTDVPIAPDPNEPSVALLPCSPLGTLTAPTDPLPDTAAVRALTAARVQLSVYPGAPTEPLLLRRGTAGFLAVPAAASAESPASLRAVIATVSGGALSASAVTLTLSGAE